MRSLVVGYGEIGRAVGLVIGNHNWLDLRVGPPAKTYEVLHICLPYSEDFVDIVKAYISQYKAEHVIIWSTVPIGTTRQIPGVVHSPVESRHPELAQGIKSMIRWIGANDKGEGEFFEKYFKGLQMATKVVNNSDFTEALKLLSTTEYGINIVFADYKKRIADDIGMDFKLTKDWNRAYNKLYHNLGLGDIFQKFVLDAPEGKIGGHCVRENSRILNQQYPDDWVKRIGDMK